MVLGDSCLTPSKVNEMLKAAMEMGEGLTALACGRGEGGYCVSGAQQVTEKAKKKKVKGSIVEPLAAKPSLPCDEAASS